MGQSDNQLIKEILNGNEAAMELLVKRYYAMIQSFIYRLTGDYNLSYDLTQEIFIKMMKGLNRYDYRKGDFKPWIQKKKNYKVETILKIALFVVIIGRDVND